MGGSDTSTLIWAIVCLVAITMATAGAIIIFGESPDSGMIAAIMASSGGVIAALVALIGKASDLQYLAKSHEQKLDVVGTKAMEIQADVKVQEKKIDVVGQQTDGRLTEMQSALERALAKISDLTGQTMQQAKVETSSPPEVGL